MLHVSLSPREIDMRRKSCDADLITCLIPVLMPKSSKKRKDKAADFSVLGGTKNGNCT
jgi:hypothetical protein